MNGLRFSRSSQQTFVGQERVTKPKERLAWEAKQVDDRTLLKITKKIIQRNVY